MTIGSAPPTSVFISQRMRSSTSSDSHSARVGSLRDRIDDRLSSLTTKREPRSLYEPVQYVLRGGGKRIRPVILLLVANAYGRSISEALPGALAVEVFHNFTLVHDDIMDDARERRGRATVHVKWDLGTAILTGDLMMGLSYDLLGQVDGVAQASLYEVFHPMVEQLCTGQALDASFEKQEEVSVDAYLEMIDGKTGALLSAAFELGGVIGGVSASAQEQLGNAGALVGRAFQIQDDLLDLTADVEEWGKAIGGDLVAGKKTFLTLRALELAEGEEYNWFARLLTDGGLPREDVAEAHDRMKAMGIFQEAREAVNTYTAQALELLECLPDNSQAHTLEWLLRRLRDRHH